MRSSMSRFIQSLESRTFLSASPATLAQDQQQLQADIAAYATDGQSCKMLIAKDKGQVSADGLATRTKLAALQKQLQKDQATRNATLAADRANDRIAEAGDKAVLTRDKIAMHVDRNNSAQLAADKNKFIQDEIQLASDHVKFTTLLLNDDATTQSIILVDQQAIVTTRSTSDNRQLLQDQQTLLADQKSCLATLAGDQIRILNDRLKITRDTATA